MTSRRARADDCSLAAAIVSAGVRAPASFARDSAIVSRICFSCAAKPFTVSTRFGMRSFRRWSWFCTSPQAPLIDSSSVVNRLYEQAGSVRSTTATSNDPNQRVRVIGLLRPADGYQPPPPPPPPLRPPPNPPKPPAAESAPTEAAATAAPAPVGAAEGADAARPAAPRTRGPVALPPASPPVRQEEDQQDDHDDQPDRELLAAALAGRGAHRRQAVERDAAILRDAAGEPHDARLQARAVLPLAEVGDHLLARGLAGEPVRDRAFEPVAHLDPHPAIPRREQHEQAVVLATLADAASLVLEEPDRVVADVRVRLRRPSRWPRR